MRKILFLAIVLPLLFTACENDNNGSGKDDYTKLTLNASSIEGDVAGIDEVRAIIAGVQTGAYLNITEPEQAVIPANASAPGNTIAVKPFSDGGFTITLPAPVDESLLHTMEAIEGVENSNPGVKTANLTLWGFSGDANTSKAFYQGNAGFTSWISYFYAAEDFTYKGQYESGIRTYVYAASFVAGWNKVFVSAQTIGGKATLTYKTDFSETDLVWHCQTQSAASVSAEPLH